MSVIVLIATPEHLPVFQAKGGFGETHSFVDTEALKALEVILRERPQTVVIDRTFADTSRGTALINRIKADPTLVACEIRILSHEGAARRAAAAPAAAKPPAPAAAKPAAPPPAQVGPLDQRGTRRAPRFRIVDDVEVLIDGNPATLVDLSVAGAQVVSVTALKPNQRVRLVLQNVKPQVRLNGGVAWAAFEIPKAGPRYRAGVEFADPDPEALNRFIEKKKR